MGLLRQRGFMMAAATCVVLALYFVMVAGRAVIFIRTGEPLSVGIGWALLVLPVIGAWWMVREWQLSAAVHRMAAVLETEGRLPVVLGETTASGKLTAEAAEEFFAAARGQVDERPEDWSAWFHVGFAYDANGDRSMARRSLLHAARLFRAR